MRILVINGSPKGKYSVTLQTVNYLEKLNPQDEFVTIHAGQQIRKLEKDFSLVMAEVEKADVLLFSYPVYTFIAPYQLHRFIELLKQSGVNQAGKYATQITTSKHFYDVTAHRYIQDNCQDMGLKFIRGLSADMDDLTKKTGPERGCFILEPFHLECEKWLFFQQTYTAVFLIWTPISTSYFPTTKPLLTNL